MTWSLKLSQAEAKNLAKEQRTLVSGVIEEWEATAAFPLATVRSSLGQTGCLKTEAKVGDSYLAPQGAV